MPGDSDVSENSANLENKECNVLAGGSVEVTNASKEPWFKEREYIVGTKALSRESLTLVTTEEDPVWSKLVNWIVLAIHYAEQQNITKDNSGEMPEVYFFEGDLKKEMLQNAIKEVGSYGEIWAKNAASNGLPREGRNQMITNTSIPLLMSDLRWDEPPY